MSDPRKTVAGAAGVDPTYLVSETSTFSRYVKRQQSDGWDEWNRTTT